MHFGDEDNAAHIQPSISTGTRRIVEKQKRSIQSVDSPIGLVRTSIVSSTQRHTLETEFSSGWR
jgi:hypothetical protein